MELQPTPQPDQPIEPPSSTRAAIEALLCDKAEKTRLYRYAQFRMLPIRQAVHHSDSDDLVNEAIERTLNGRRPWNATERTMLQHLLRTACSVADEWYKEMKRYAELSDVHASSDTAYAQLLWKSALERVMRRLKGDVLASAVLESMLRDEKPSEAISALKVSKKVYEAARRRVVRQGQKIFSSSWSARA